MIEPNPPLLQAHALVAGVGPVCAVRGLELALHAGDCLGVLGRNGVGKSTLLATLAGLHAPRAGSLAWAGRPLRAWRPREAARLRGWLPQAREDAFPASVLETVLVGRHPWLGRFAWEGETDFACARAALAEVGMAGYEARRIDSLSGGERQRVALAALIAQAPRLWLLDEPLAHLDPGHQAELLALLARRAAAGAAVVMVVHELNLALRACNRLLLLEGGGRWHCGPSGQMADAALLSRVYGHPLRAVPDGDNWLFVPA